jgi:hypothetical protein
MLMSRARVISILILALAFNLVPYIRWLNTLCYHIRDGAESLLRAIGEEPAVIIGEWAGPLCLETPYRSFYVKNIFNRRPDQLASFGITHLLYSDPELDPAAISFHESFPTAFEKRQLIATIGLFDQTLYLYHVSRPGIDGPKGLEEMP